MSERQADPRCRCGAPHSDPLHTEEPPMPETTTTLNLRERARQGRLIRPPGPAAGLRGSSPARALRSTYDTKEHRWATPGVTPWNG